MSHKTRRILFFISIILFFLAAGPVIFYTQGYRISWTDFSLTPTGGIFIHTSPSNASVFVDSQKRNTSFISGGLFVQNLKPGPHDIRVERSNYTAWQKTLIVHPHEVTEARAVLLPKNMRTLSLIQDRIIHDAVFSPNERTAFLITSSSTESKAVFKIYNMQTKSFYTITNTSGRILVDTIDTLPIFLHWNSSETAVIVETENDWIEISLLDESRAEVRSLYAATNGLSNKFTEKPQEILFHPGEASTYYILDDQNLYSWNKEISSLILLLQSIAGISRSNGHLLLLDSRSGLLYNSNFDVRGGKPVSTTSVSGIENTLIHTSGSSYILVSNTGLLVIPPGGNQPIQLTKRISPNKVLITNTSVLWWDTSSINVYWTLPKDNLPYFQNSFKETIYTSSGTNIISGAFYYPNEPYLIISEENSVYLLEIDGRDNQRNKTLLYEGVRPIIHPSSKERVLFIIDKGELLRVNL